MESTISPIEAKEHLKSKKFGELVRIEFSNKGKIQNEKNDENIFFASSIHDIEDAMWLLDDTPQVVFATSGKINSEVDDFATILLEFKDNKTIVISSNWVTSDHQRTCEIVCSHGEISLDLTKDKIDVQNENDTNSRKIAEAAFLSSQKGIPIYLDLK